MPIIALSVVLGLLLIYGIYAFFVTRQRIDDGKRIAVEGVVFEQTVGEPKSTVLVIGDSSGVGVGGTPEESVAGRLASDFPETNVVNRSVSGNRVADLIETFNPSPDEAYDLVIIHIGGNDIVHGTDLEEVREGFIEVLERAKSVSENVVHIHGGNVGNAPIFLPPANWYMSGRTKKYRDIFKEENEKAGVLYADIYKLEEAGERGDHEKPNKDWFAIDAFHPSAASYAFWYEAILDELERGGVKL